MPRNLIETLNGEGKVFEGKEFVADVSYVARVYQNYSETRLLNGGMTRTKIGEDVEIQINPFSSIGFLLGKCLTLQMSDGRKQDFFPVSSNGECRATGGMH
jgi:hypothetical protein